MLWTYSKTNVHFIFILKKYTPYPRSMFIFPQIAHSFLEKTLVRIERSKIGKYVFSKFRKKIN